jgi:hypothetical protein
MVDDGGPFSPWMVEHDLILLLFARAIAMVVTLCIGTLFVVFLYAVWRVG